VTTITAKPSTHAKYLPSWLEGTFFEPGCTTYQRELSAARQGAMSDDLDAIQRVLGDDIKSFRRLVERYQRPLLTLVRNAKWPHLV
jgi:hypothetical protein